MGEPVWIVLPGMTMPPEDFQALAGRLPGCAEVFDAYAVALTAPASAVRDWLWTRRSASRVCLVGHSAGGMTALEWLLSFPGEVERVVLLESTDPNERPSRLSPGTLGHRCVRRLLRAAGAWPWLARRLGRAGRRAFWRLFTVQPDHLPKPVIDRVWGNSAGLLAVWDQVFDRFSQEERVRTLLAAWERDGRAFSAPVLSVLSDDAEPYQQALAQRLGAEVAAISGGHLFPVLQPEGTADLITGWLRTRT
ncbi:MAG: alpha/beta hydrolase [Propionibacteriaceae bacterium]|jgi:pimeloyl-ACP methyl ester carboxylesterase|nr:alpha/beta hydrolase [Propionibacteriaceae bacterium]